MSAPTCPAGHSMRVESQFRFDHEPGDSPRDRESLQRFEQMGVELGAEVTVWYCERCDYARADFAYDDAEART